MASRVSVTSLLIPILKVGYVAGSGASFNEVKGSWSFFVAIGADICMFVASATFCLIATKSAFDYRTQKRWDAKLHQRRREIEASRSDYLARTYYRTNSVQDPHPDTAAIVANEIPASRGTPSYYNGRSGRSSHVDRRSERGVSSRSSSCPSTISSYVSRGPSTISSHLSRGSRGRRNEPLPGYTEITVI